MITLLARLLKILNSDDSPSQIALAVVLAAIMGLTPLYSVHNIPVLLLVLVVRINLTMFLLSLGLFTLIAYLVDPLSQALGHALLTSAALEEIWTALYQSSLWRLTAFNNTLVIGSLTLSLALSPLLFIAIRYSVLQYRERLMTWARQSRIGLMLQSGRILNAYQALP